MRLLLLEPDPEQARVVRRALLEVTGTTVSLLVAEHLGELAPLLDESPDVVVLPDQLPWEPPHQQPDGHPTEGPAETLLLAWYIARRCPETTLWLWHERELPDSEMADWLPMDRALRYPYPRQAEQVWQWVEALRQHHALAYGPGHKPDGWWRERRWLVVDPQGETVAQHALEDPELAADLLKFLSLKAEQIAESLGQPGWSYVELGDAERQAHVLHLPDRSRAIAMRDSSPVPRLPKKLLQKLQTRQLVAPCP